MSPATAHTSAIRPRVTAAGLNPSRVLTALDIGQDCADLQQADEVELLISCEEDRTLRAVLIGCSRRSSAIDPSARFLAVDKIRRPQVESMAAIATLACFDSNFLWAVWACCGRYAGAGGRLATLGWLACACPSPWSLLLKSQSSHSHMNWPPSSVMYTQ